MLAILNAIALIVGYVVLAALPALWLWAAIIGPFLFGRNDHDPRDSGE